MISIDLLLGVGVGGTPKVGQKGRMGEGNEMGF